MQRLSEAEELVMKEIWQLGHPVTAGELTTLLTEEKGWKLQTVSTFLVRLVEKELLTKEKQQGQNFYLPTVSEADYRAEQTRRFVAEMHGGSVKNLLASLYDDSNLKEEDIDALRRWLEGREHG